MIEMIRDKARLKALEQSCTDIQNVIRCCDRGKMSWDPDTVHFKLMALHRFLHARNMTATVRKVSRVIGRPLYHAQYVRKNAVWGMEIAGIVAILYYSPEGMSISVSPGATPAKAMIVVEELHEAFKGLEGKP